MVGYIIGLGDRHGENILVDQVTGEVMHVDYNCLFEKGLMVATPEVVPFRLTQNMIDAFGVSETHGLFKEFAILTMQILRNNHVELETILETFIHDPLFLEESQTPVCDPLFKDKGMKALAIVARKLHGQMQAGLSLSVEGQVEKLILDAKDIKKLCLLYIGWGPWL